VGRLEDQRHAQLARERGETLGVPQRRVAALDDARAGDDRERRAAADAERSDLDPPAHLPDPAAATLDSSSGWCPDTRSRWSIAARMKLLKIGWQSSGRDLNSGWNWLARNHGWLGSSIISTSLPSGDSPENTSPCFCSS